MMHWEKKWFRKSNSRSGRCIKIGNRSQFTVIGSRLKKQNVEKNYKVYKYCTGIGCGAENTGLYFTRG